MPFRSWAKWTSPIRIPQLSLHFGFTRIRRLRRDWGQKPVQTSFAGLEFHFPQVSSEDQFVVPFRDAQNLVDRFGPFARNALFSHRGAKGPSQRIAKAHRTGQESLCGVRIRAGESEKAGSALC